MKISFWLPHLKIAGGTRITLGYADALARRGHDVSVVVVNPSPFRRLFSNLLRVKPGWQRGLRARIVRIASWERAPKADVVIADSWQVARAFVRSGNPACGIELVQHDERLYHGNPDEVTATYQLPLPKIVVATWLQEMLRSDFGQGSTVLLNPIDRNLFFPVPVRRDSDIVRILLLDHDYVWKGTAEGVELVERLKEQYPEVRLIMFGVRKTACARAADEYHFAPPQKKLCELYSSCDIYLCPSWEEGSGLPSMEAMLCGMALVTYDNGGSRDYAIDGKTAFVAAHRDKGDILRRLETAVVDASKRKETASAGRERIQGMPTREEQTERLEGILKELCA